MARSDSLVVPVRFRITIAERERYQEVMKRLKLTEFSAFARWALENSATQVLGVPAQKASAPRRPPRPPKTPTPPAPVRHVEPGPAQPTLLGIPLYASPNDPRPALVDDDEWI